MFSKFSINQRMIILIALAGSVAGGSRLLSDAATDMQGCCSRTQRRRRRHHPQAEETKVPYGNNRRWIDALVPSAQVHDLTAAIGDPRASPRRRRWVRDF